MEYHIVEAVCIEDLSTMIENYLNSGWKLQGGISVIYFQKNENLDLDKPMFKFFQAIYKHRIELCFDNIINTGNFYEAADLF